MHFSIRPSALWRTSEKPPWLLSIRSSKWFILFTISMAIFTDIFLYAVIVPVMPFALRTRANVKEDEIQSWISILIAVYGGALAVSSPICGWAADHSSSRRLPLVLGLLALAGATILLNLGPNIGILVLGRILQGISAAVVWCVGLALVSDTVDQAEIGQTMGYVFVAMSLGILVGPLLGGVVFAKGGYNEVFAMAYVLIGVDVALRLLMIEKKVARRWEKTESIDKAADVVRTGPIENESKSSQKAQDKQSSHIHESATQHRDEAEVDKIAPHPTSNNELALQQPSSPSSPVKSRQPSMVVLIKSRRLLCALWGCCVVATLMTQFDSVLPLYVKSTFGWNSTAAGLIFLPLTLTAFLSPVVGWAVDKYGPRWFAVGGFVMFAPFEILLRLVDHDTLGQKVLLCFLLTLIGISLDLCTPPLMVEITAVVEAKEQENPGLFGKRGAYAQAYGLFNSAWAGGCLIGPIWAGFVNEHAGWGTMAWTLALLGLLTALPVGVWTGGSIFKKRRRRDQEAQQESGGIEMSSVQGTV